MNPFKPHALSVFADRETIEEALTYAMDVINRLPDHKPQALTALMVVVNTAAKLWPETPADADAQSDAGNYAALARRVSEIEADLQFARALADRVSELEVRPVTPEALTQGIEAWAEDNLGTHIENWADTYLDNRIESWAESNIDVEDQVRDTLRNATISLDI